MIMDLQLYSKDLLNGIIRISSSNSTAVAQDQQTESQLNTALNSALATCDGGGGGGGT